MWVWPYPFWGLFVILRLVFVMAYQRTKFVDYSFTNSKDMTWAPKFKGHAMLTTPLSGVFVIHRLGLAMVNLCTKFEVNISTHYEDMKVTENVHKCVSSLARRIPHHMALVDTVAPNSDCPPSLAAGFDICFQERKCHPYYFIGTFIPEVMPPRDSPRANLHQKGRRPVRIVGQHECKISCPGSFRWWEIRNRTKEKKFF